MIADESIDGLQIRVVSDATSIEGIVNVEPASVMLADYFVFIVDNFAKVVIDKFLKRGYG